MVPSSNPGLASNWAGAQAPPWAGLTAQVKVAEPAALVVSVAVTVTLPVPGVVGVPVIRPVDGAMDSPAGSPAAV